MQLTARTFFFLILLVALPIAAQFFLFAPMREQQRVTEERTREKREKLAQLDKVRGEKNDLRDEIEKYKKAITFFESKLPEEKEMDKVLRDISQNAEKNGMNVKSVRNMKVVDGDAYSEQPIRMVIVGQTTGFHKFLQSVEHMERITRIGEMTLEGDETGNGNVTADFTLTIFFEKSGDKSST